MFLIYFFDYIHTSIKILEEITVDPVVKLKEKIISYLCSLLDLKIYVINMEFLLCQLHSLMVLSRKPTPDQNLLRGAKAIADKIDYGAILLNVKSDDLVALEPILSTNQFSKPNIKMSIYKNRRGRYKGVYLWCKAELGTCRVIPMFCTSYDYELQTMEDIKIITAEEINFE